jgi:WD40 repeat protein
MVSLEGSTAYYFAATAEDKLSSSRQARWDPNAPGCFGVSQDDGTFRYCTPDGGSACFQLFASAEPLIPAGAASCSPRVVEARLRPAPVSTPWSHWTFVPGQAGHLLFAHRNSDQLMQTCVPAGAVLDTSASSVPASRVWMCREATSTSPLTALAVSDDGARAGVGERDGSVAFWPLAPSGPTKQPVSAAVFKGAHRGPITALALLCDSLPQYQLQLDIAVSGSVDQTLRVWDYP